MNKFIFKNKLRKKFIKWNFYKQQNYYLNRISMKNFMLTKVFVAFLIIAWWVFTYQNITGFNSGIFLSEVKASYKNILKNII